MNGLQVAGIVCVVVGVAGTALPVLPGVPLVLVGLVLVAWADQFVHVGPWTFALLGVLTLAGIAVDFLATLLGARRVGASRPALIGAAAGYLILWAIYWAFRLLTGREGMGAGDFKLLAAIGAWLGWQLLPLVILLSSLVGAVVGITLILLTRHGRNVPIPFGPYLAAAGLIALFWGRSLNQTYLGLF